MKAWNLIFLKIQQHSCITPSNDWTSFRLYQKPGYRFLQLNLLKYTIPFSRQVNKMEMVFLGTLLLTYLYFSQLTKYMRLHHYKCWSQILGCYCYVDTPNSMYSSPKELQVTGFCFKSLPPMFIAPRGPISPILISCSLCK